ncbi:MAG TPA: CHAD domain-containing protein [Flavisolibacter sp.]|nr:CHAD domain-containing protein [Flavisolibacter sp.]
MKKELIIDAYKTRFKKLSNFYQKVPEEFDMDDIHHFRVEMKKLRAFIRLTNLTTPDQQKKIPKELKRFYNTCGNIRNLQLQQQRITNLASDLLMEAPDLYLQYLRDEEKLAKKKAHELAENISLKQFEKDLIDSSTGLIQEIKKVFVQRNKQRLSILFTLPFYYDEALHDIRKVVKDLMYNYKYVDQEINVELPPDLASLKNMETLTTSLGDFHDLCIALFLLSPMYLNQIPGLIDNELLSEFRSQLELRKEAMKKEIIQLFAPVKQQFEKERSLMQSYELT